MSVSASSSRFRSFLRRPLSARKRRTVLATLRTPPKALIIGLDGAGFDIIDRLVSAGRLPNLAALLGAGASAPVDTTWPAHTAPGWSSFVTGRRPGGHGVYQFFDTQDPGYGAHIMGSSDLGCSSAWDWLAAQGWSLGLVNVPMSHPPRDLPGYQITWPLQQTIRYCRPAGLLAELARNGVHFQSDLATMFRGDLGYLDEAVANVEARVRSLEYLMTAHPTDLVMAVLTEADRVCHHYWHFWDPGHPQHAPAPEGSGWDEAIERIYGALDDGVGRLLEMVGDETSVVVASDHGLGVGRYGVAVHRLLEDAGLLTTVPAGGARDGGQASWFTGQERSVDFGRTRVYMPVPGSYGLNVNLAGRQRDGVVAERDRAAVLAEAAALLEDLRTPGRSPVFSAVVPRDVVYPGVHVGRAPDLLLVPRDESVLPVTDLEGPVWRPSWQTGLHRYQGMWIHRSPRVTPGRLAGPVRIVDLLPTLLAELGASWPDSIDGHPVPVVRERQARPLGPLAEDEVVAPAPAGPTEEDLYTSQRLREMGYL
ncbi:alkaline phosphatase family protein [Sphaerisporangium krabiense]|uniref:alkaline phosphatase family protein n=1 Tax=Sphaerisporangium krabiense TaxID=763782 RepID=UPI001EF36C06|nr:alkaline phosphatase family protein [Sphaerisporangium krabiense]